MKRLLGTLLAETHKQRRISAVIISFGIVLLVGIWFGLYIKIESEKQIEIANAMKETSNLARSVEEHTLRTIMSIDQTALFLKYQYEQHPTAFDIPQYIKEGRLLQENIVLLSICNEAGEVVASSQVPMVVSNIKDREHFRVHQQRDTKQLFISKPVLGRSSGKWSIQMTRRINKPDGSFGGVVVVSVDPFYFTRFYSQLKLGQESVVALCGADKVVRARLAGTEVSLGQDLQNTEFDDRLTAAQAEGSFVIHSPLDRVKRIYSYRQLKEYPLVLMVGIAETEVLYELRQRAVSYYWVAGFFSLIIVVFLTGLLYSTLKQRQHARFLRLLNDTSLRTMHCLQMEEVLEEILYAANGITGSFDSFIVLLDRHEQIAQVRAAAGVSRFLLERPLRSECCLTKLVWQQEEIAVIDSCQQCPELLQGLSRGQSLQLVAVPLLAAERRIGSLVIPLRQSERLTTQQVADLEQFAVLAATAVERTRLHGLLSKELQERKAIQDELLAAKEAAEEANRAKSDFLASMSHEIRTPMNAIMGMTHILQETPLSTKQREYMQKIQEAAQLLLTIINNVFDLSKLEVGRLELQQANFKPHEIMAELSILFAPKAAAKGVELLFTMDEEVPACLSGDVFRFKQICINLLSNAVKFTQEGSIKVHLKVVSRSHRSLTLAVSVQDTGIGMSAAEKDKLFQLFSQADGSTTRRFGGTGLGLVISKRLVMLMGGSMRVDSQRNQGSTFTFTVPFAYGEEQAAAASVQENTRTTVGTILLAEDNKINQAIVKKILRQAGYAVVITENGQLAAELALQGNYAAVIMDIEMPILNGLEATQLIRQKKTKSELPIIGLTADERQERQRAALAAGMNEHLTKPVQPQQLLAALARFGQQPLPSRDAGQSEFATLHGFDTVSALSRLQGDCAIYKQLLRQFQQTLYDFSQDVPALLTVENWQQAARLVHGLRGAGANLGAKQLADAARRVERCLRAHEADAGIRLQEFLSAVADISAVLEQWQLTESLTAVPDEVSISAPPQPEKVAMWLGIVMRCAEAGLVVPEEAVAALRKELQHSAVSELFQQLQAALRVYDFEEALVKARRIAAVLRITPGGDDETCRIEE